LRRQFRSLRGRQIERESARRFALLGGSDSGIGYIDAHLLASCALTPNAALWTRDKALRACATRCGVAPKQKLS
jgi:hypothetical protein